ncbi:MAG: hypothetical protein M3463_12385 [Verrucomicrobiota bacterium]|nr:hypothetical protein [Verrucomicrobiota bacterium]
MSAAEIIQEIKRLPDEERDQLIDWFLKAHDDEVFSHFDRMPRKCTLTEEEILALPRRAGAIRRKRLDFGADDIGDLPAHVESRTGHVRKGLFVSVIPRD